jgi:hypothetical protein
VTAGDAAGMDQGSDFISDFRARRICTQMTGGILLANCHEATEFCLMRVAGSGTASAGAGSDNEGNKAMKDGEMIRGQFPGIDSPGLIHRGRLQWDTHETSVYHARGLSGSRNRL